MINKYILIGIIILISVSDVSATKKVCWADGNETGVYSSFNEALIYHSNYNDVYIQYTVCSTISESYSFVARKGASTGYGSPCTWAHMDSGLTWINPGGKCVSGCRYEDKGYDLYNNRGEGDYTITFVISIVPFVEFTCSGTQLCTDYVKLYILSDIGYKLIETNTTEEYSFTILNNTDYSIVFSDGTYHNFTCTGNEVYDYNACTYTLLHLKDYCGYTMFGACSDIYMSDGGEPSSYEFVDHYQWQYEINLSSVDAPIGKMLDIFFDTDMGTHHEILYADGGEHSIFHPTKFWRMTFTVLDEDTLIPIENARIVAEQACTIDPTHPPKQYLFTDENGQGTFIGLSGGFFNFSIWATGYKIDRAWYGGYGFSAFVTDYYDTAYMNVSRNETIDPRNETANVTEGCFTYFTNENGIKTNRINDTDSLVYLNYSNSNCSSTLKFQRLYGSYWMTKASYNIPALQNGSKTILNSNFSEYDACYRSYMYSYECDCNNTHSLYVLNETVQEEQHYENLSSHCRFKHQMGGGQVDYKSPVEILTYAYTNTSHTLLRINLTLYNSSGVIAEKQCYWADFAGASPKWYYVWSPSVSYNIGENYTVVMTGYNGHNLSADDVWTSNIRNNKLTITVKDNYGDPVTYSTVFVEGWGSQASGNTNIVAITGFPNGDIQYKATKSGYITSVWNTVTLSDGDESVECVLVKESITIGGGLKMTDSRVKSFLIPGFYLLLIIILVGGVTNANKR